MTVDREGKEGAHRPLPRLSSRSIASLDDLLNTLVDRMDAEVKDRGTITTASARELRELRLRAEQLFQESYIPPRR